MGRNAEWKEEEKKGIAGKGESRRCVLLFSSQFTVSPKSHYLNPWKDYSEQEE